MEFMTNPRGFDRNRRGFDTNRRGFGENHRSFVTRTEAADRTGASFANQDGILYNAAESSELADITGIDNS